MPRNRAFSPQSRIILSIFLAQPSEWRHGYDLAKSAGLSSGTLYPLLIRLHERGMLVARWEQPSQPGRPARHAYRLSSAGVARARALGESEAVVPLANEAFA